VSRGCDGNIASRGDTYSTHPAPRDFSESTILVGRLIMGRTKMLPPLRNYPGCWNRGVKGSIPMTALSQGAVTLPPSSLAREAAP
jgi:hypothetical protein